MSLLTINTIESAIDKTYTKLVYEVGTDKFICQAHPNTAVTDAKWRITKVDSNGSHYFPLNENNLPDPDFKFKVSEDGTIVKATGYAFGVVITDPSLQTIENHKHAISDVNGLTPKLAETDLLNASAQGTGWISGGTLTINAGTPTFNITTDCKCRFVDQASGSNVSSTDVVFTAKSNINAGLTAGAEKWIGLELVNGVATLVYDYKFSHLRRRNVAIIGRVWMGNDGNIAGIGNYTVPAFGYEKTFEDWTETFGKSQNISGNTYSTPNSNLHLDKSAGVAFRFGANSNVDDASPNIIADVEVKDINEYFYLRSDNHDFIIKNAIDPSMWDDGTNGLKALTASKWSVQRIYHWAKSNVTGIAYGQVQYDTLELAEINAFKEKYVYNESFTGATLRGFLIVRSDCTSLTDATKAKFLDADVDATPALSAADIKTKYESNTDTNVFSDSLKAKLENITDNYKGYFKTATALKAALPSGGTGWYVNVESTDTIWMWDSDTTKWKNTKNSLVGDMTKAVYDPNGKNADVYAIDNIDDSAKYVKMEIAERKKLFTIEAYAKGDQTSEQIKKLYESNPNTNSFTDAHKNKIESIDATVIVIASVEASAKIKDGADSVCDGKTDSKIINKAIEDIGVGRGATIQLVGGNFYLKAKATGSNECIVVDKEFVQIVGVGKIKLLSSSSNFTAISIRKPNTTIRNIEFGDWQAGGASSAVLRFGTAVAIDKGSQIGNSNTVIENCAFKPTKNYAITVADDAEGTDIVNNNFFTGGRLISTHGKRGLITFNTTDTNQSAAILLETDSADNHVTCNRVRTDITSIKNIDDKSSAGNTVFGNSEIVAAQIGYDDTKAKLAETTVQGAITKLAQKTAKSVATNTDLALKVSKIETAIDTNETGIATNKTGITTNKNEVATNKTFIDDLKSRVTETEKFGGEITNNTRDIAKNTLAIATNVNQISQIRGLASSALSKTDEITTNTTNITANAAQIKINKDDITTLKAAVDTNTSGVATNKAEVSYVKNTANANRLTIASHNITIPEHTAKLTDIERNVKNGELTVHSVGGAVFDKSTSTPDHFSPLNVGTGPYAFQLLKPASDTKISKISARIKSTSTTAGVVSVWIRKGSVPGGGGNDGIFPVKIDVTVNHNGIDVIEFPLLTPVTLTAGQEYYLEFWGVSGETKSIGYMSQSSETTFSNGWLYAQEGAATWNTRKTWAIKIESSDAVQNGILGYDGTDLLINNKPVALKATALAGQFSKASNGGLYKTGRNEANYGDIGQNAVDLSYSAIASETFGASGYSALANGVETSATGYASHAEGRGTIAKAPYSHAAGRYNKAATFDTLHETGIGTATLRKNGFEIYKDGLVTAPEATIATINKNPRALTTKEYVDNKVGTGGGSGQLSKAANGGLFRTGRDETKYGDVGENAIDLSNSGSASTTHGATGVNSFAEGASTIASGNFSTVFGTGSIASGAFATAFGRAVKASGKSSVAGGDATVASGAYSIATGRNSEAIGSGSAAHGVYVIAKNEGSHSTGKFNIGTSDDTIHETGIGTSPADRKNGLEIYLDGTLTAPESSIPEIESRGNKALTTKEYVDSKIGPGGGTTSGQLSKANNDGLYKTGRDESKYGDVGPHAVDLSYSQVASTTAGATGQASHAIGEGTIAKNTSSNSAGSYNKGTSDNTIHETGIGTSDIDRKNAFEIFNDGTITAPEATIAEINLHGSKSLTTKEYVDTKFGGGITAEDSPLSKLTNGGIFRKGRDESNYGDVGENAVDLGFSDSALRTYGATGNRSFSSGYKTLASGENSHAEGQYTKATGINAHAEGVNGTASGNNSHVEGDAESAIGHNSHAEGSGTIAKNRSSHAAGRYNKGISAETIHETGIGTGQTDRKNAFEIYLDGTLTAPEATLAEIEARGNKAIPTKEYVDSKVGTGGTGSTPYVISKATNGGLFRTGRDETHFSTIGENAVDLSTTTGTSSNRGAGGKNAFAAGTDVYAFENSVAVGLDVNAYGKNSAAFGNSTSIINDNSMAIGRWNTNARLDTLFEVGIGTGPDFKRNALEVGIGGDVTAPSLEIFQINSGDAKTLTTKEYVNGKISTYPSKFSTINTSITSINASIANINSNVKDGVVTIKSGGNSVLFDKLDNTSGNSHSIPGLFFDAPTRTLSAYQLIKPTTTTPLYKVSARIKTTDATPGDVVMEVRAGGAINFTDTATILATVTKSVSHVGVATVEFVLSTPITLTAGSDYQIRITQIGNLNGKSLLYDDITATTPFASGFAYPLGPNDPSTWDTTKTWSIKLESSAAVGDAVLGYDGTNLLVNNAPVSSGGASSSGSGQLSKATNGGLYRTGRDEANYGDVGENAVDLSYSNSANTTRGATGKNSHAEGFSSTASGVASHAEGSSIASGENSHAEGGGTAAGKFSHAEGSLTIAVADSSHAEGFDTKATAKYSHAEGFRTTAKNIYSHSAGKYNIGVSDETIHETGIGTNANDRKNAFEIYTNGALTAPEASIEIVDSDPRALTTREYVINKVELFAAASTSQLTKAANGGLYKKDRNVQYYGAIGENAVDLSVGSYISNTHGATGDNSYAEGFGTTAGGNGSHAEGKFTMAIGVNSHSEGVSTTASGSGSHAEGNGGNAFGENSHSEGNFPTAIGANSHAEGDNTIAKNESSHAAGKYNVGTSTDTIHETGIGPNPSNRKNGFEIYLDGTLTAPEATNALIESRGNKALTTKEYVDSKISTAPTPTTSSGPETITFNERIALENVPDGTTKFIKEFDKVQRFYNYSSELPKGNNGVWVGVNDYVIGLQTGFSSFSGSEISKFASYGQFVSIVLPHKNGLTGDGKTFGQGQNVLGGDKYNPNESFRTNVIATGVITDISNDKSFAVVTTKGFVNAFIAEPPLGGWVGTFLHPKPDTTGEEQSDGKGHEFNLGTSRTGAVGMLLPSNTTNGNKPAILF